MAVVWLGVIQGLAWTLVPVEGEGPSAWLRAGVLVGATCVGCLGFWASGWVQVGVLAGVICGVRSVAVLGGSRCCLGDVVVAFG